MISPLAELGAKRGRFPGATTMARRLITALGYLAILVFGTQMTRAADEPAGKRVAEGSCAACHGPNGIGIIPLYPNLAGQKREYLVAQLRAFRDGSRKNAIMSPMAVHLSDLDIEEVSAYFAALK